MEKTSNYKRMLGLITLAAGLLSAACLMVGAYAVEYNFEAFSEPVLVLQYALHYQAAYRFLLLDMAGYYLLLLPLIFYLHQQFKYQSPWVPLFTFSGLAYVLTGAIGAAILASTWPYLMQQYIVTSVADKHSIELLFATLTNGVTKGLWNILEVLFAACWWLGFGSMLRRDYKILGWLSILAGTACLADAFGTMAGVKPLAEIGVNIYLLLGILWPLAFGVHLLRKSLTQSPLHRAVIPNTFIINEETHAEA